MSVHALQVAAISGLAITSLGPSYTLLQLLRGMLKERVDPSIYAPLARLSSSDVGLPAYTGGIGIEAVDMRLPMARLPFRKKKAVKSLTAFYQRRAERRLLKNIGNGRYDVVFSWGQISTDFSRSTEECGHPACSRKVQLRQPGIERHSAGCLSRNRRA